ncbi:hypothetical protein GCM10008915_36720 [Bifidobacterium pullorum subsp. gallinarum]
MTTENKRDLAADLAVCEAAAPAFILHQGVYVVPTGGTTIETEICRDDYEPLTVSDSEFILEAREGWPEAVRRALAAEAEVERLRKDKLRLHAIYDAQYARATEYGGEVERLRDHLMYVYQKAKNDCARWDGGQCVGLPVFQDRAFARRLVRDLTPILFPEGADACV